MQAGDMDRLAVLVTKVRPRVVRRRLRSALTASGDSSGEAILECRSASRTFARE